jgi:hypothetical protein
MARNHLYETEVTALATAIGGIGDARLRKKMAVEVWEIVKQRVSLGRSQNREQWQKACRAED